MPISLRKTLNKAAPPVAIRHTTLLQIVWERVWRFEAIVKACEGEGAVFKKKNFNLI